MNVGSVGSVLNSPLPTHGTMTELTWQLSWSQLIVHQPTMIAGWSQFNTCPDRGLTLNGRRNCRWCLAYPPRLSHMCLIKRCCLKLAIPPISQSVRQIQASGTLLIYHPCRGQMVVCSCTECRRCCQFPVKKIIFRIRSVGSESMGNYGAHLSQHGPAVSFRPRSPDRSHLGLTQLCVYNCS